jgi:hypothetical protein
VVVSPVVGLTAHLRSSHMCGKAVNQELSVRQYPARVLLRTLAMGPLRHNRVSRRTERAAAQGAFLHEGKKDGN